MAQSSPDLLSILEKLISMPTVTASAHRSAEAILWVREQVAAQPVHITDFESGGFSSLLVTTRETNHPHLLLVAHIDVVPAPPAAFTSRVKNGRLYGRGAHDMKFAIACYLKLLAELGSSLPEYDIGMLITSDEETNGRNGMRTVLDSGICADFAVDPDGATDWTIEREAKGRIVIRATATGVSGHGAYPWQGVNAITTLIEFIQDLRAQFQAEPCGDPSHGHDNMNVGVIAGGDAYNQIPGHATAEIDVRITSTTGLPAIERLLGEVNKRHPSVSLTTIDSYGPTSHDLSHPLVKLYQDLVTGLVGVRPKSIVSHGGSDAKYLELAGIPCLVSKPVGGLQHSDDEWI
jgi:succinyl-diaminopimelate desuccinylase